MQDFDKIYAEYYSIVYKFVMGLCQSRETAEEITQEAFFKALKNIDSFKGNCKISTWLCQIAKNTFYSHAKKQIKNTVYPTGGVISDENIEKSFEDKDEAFLVLKVLHKLKEPYKEVFYLRTFGELSFSQIGLIFGKTESWARVTYHRSKIKIREELK